MSRKKTKAQIIDSDNQRAYQKTQKVVVETSEFCKKYLQQKELFKWFIEKYFGLKKYMELWGLAEKNEEPRLREELNDIWYQLPDSIFNVVCAPAGWSAFLSLIED